MNSFLLFLTLFYVGPLAPRAQGASAPPPPPGDRIQVRLRQMLDVPDSVRGPISLDLKSVILAAMMRSDSFKTLLSKVPMIPVDRLEQEALTDSFFFAQGKQEWNRNQPNSLFGTNRFDQTSVDLGVEKRLASGTRLTLGLSEFRNNSAFGSFGNVDSRVAGGRLNLSQSLWRDFFGSSTRKLLDSGKAKSDAKKIQLESEIEDWFLQLSGLFHQVWMAQKRIEATRASLERKERLASLFARRKSLGISEEAEQLQVEAAVKQTRVQLEEMTRLLEKQWSLLVVSLKLGEEDRRTDPTLIPVLLGTELPDPGTDCASPADSNREIKQLELELAALQLQSGVALDQARPELVLDLGIGTNGSVLNATDEFQTRWLNTLTARFPAYTIGLGFRVPLDASIEKSRILSSLSMTRQLESQVSDLRARMISTLETSCAELAMLGRHYRLYAGIERDMNKRIRLEETRYRQARSSPFAVLQAGDELYGTTLSLHSTLAEWWNRHWSLKKTKGLLFQELDDWVNKKTGKNLFNHASSGSMP
ncbi:MAG: TolC family protein [Bdellovibrionales bacterium]|nr:TolC family protein [Bdellovibrionales bacterium]